MAIQNAGPEIYVFLSESLFEREEFSLYSIKLHYAKITPYHINAGGI